MNLEIILHAGLATGTILLFASIGELLAERSGVLNLGVEGMMLLGAMTGFSVSLATGNPWIGLLMAMLAADLSMAHGVVTISFQADQVVSGLALTFLGTGLALVLGNGLTGQNAPLIPSYDIPVLASIPFIGPVFFKDHSSLVYFGYVFTPLVWYYIEKTRPGMHLRAIGEKPVAADTMGVSVYGLRYLYVFAGGCLAGLAGATISLSVSPGWYSVQTTAGQGWIAIGLVIFAQWNPLRAALGAYLFGALRRAILDLQGPRMLLSFVNPLFINPNLGFFLQMAPYLLTILALVIGPRTAMRKHLGAPAALGEPTSAGSVVCRMLPQSHIAYTWLALSVAQDLFGVAEDADYRLVALAAAGPDLIDKPLATAYFYRKYKSAVLFAHTLLTNLALLWITAARLPQLWVYTSAFLGHAVLDRLWLFPNTFYWPLRGWRFHVWGKQGSEQAAIGNAYWVAFTRRKELWGWEVGGLAALTLFVWRRRLYRRDRLVRFLWSGRVE